MKKQYLYIMFYNIIQSVSYINVLDSYINTQFSYIHICMKPKTEK